MRAYTIQMGKWRKAKAQGVPLLDATVKSGHTEVAPTWDMVRLIKDAVGDITTNEVRYTALYNAMLAESYKNNREWWDNLLSMNEVCIGCYCKACTFCHRHLIIKFLRQLCEMRGIEFIYGGEIT